jgi:hypothetical protein
MSALELRPVKLAATGSDACIESDCQSKGRYSISIADYPVASDSLMAIRGQARLCKKHAEAWRELWDELSGVETETAVAA